MSPVLPFDVIVQIIDTIAENEDTNLLKELALVSHCFHQICSKHLFATIELHDAHPKYHVPSSKKGFVKLLKSRPEVVNYIRKLIYIMYGDRLLSFRFLSSDLKSEDDLLSPILPNFLRTISHLNCLTIDASNMAWNEINPSVASALFHLMHLPTINHIDLSSIRNFPMSSLIPSVNLLRLDLYKLDPLEEKIVVQSEMIPKIREFHISRCPLMTTEVLDTKTQDGRLAFSFMDLRRLSTSLDDMQKVRYLLQNAKLLEKLHLTVEYGQSLVGLHNILSSDARTLKVLYLTGFIIFCDDYRFHPPLAGVCEELEALAGHNNLEALSIEIEVRADYDETEDSIGSMIQNVEKVLVKPGWSALRQVSFKVPIQCFLLRDGIGLCETLQSLPDKYLNHLPKLESIVFNFSSYAMED